MRFRVSWVKGDQGPFNRAASENAITGVILMFLAGLSAGYMDIFGITLVPIMIVLAWASINLLLAMALDHPLKDSGRNGFITHQDKNSLNINATFLGYIIALSPRQTTPPDDL